MSSVDFLLLTLHLALNFGEPIMKLLIGRNRLSQPERAIPTLSIAGRVVEPDGWCSRA